MKAITAECLEDCTTPEHGRCYVGDIKIFTQIKSFDPEKYSYLKRFKIVDVFGDFDDFEADSGVK